MSRKDYVAIAEAFAEARARTADVLGSSYVLRVAAQNVAAALAADNPRFNRDRFMDAAGFPEE